MEFSRRYDGSLAVHSFPWRMPGRCPRPADPWIPQESRPLVVGGRVSGHGWKGVPSGPPSLVPPRALQGRSVPPSLRSVRYSRPFGTPCGRPFRARGPRHCPAGDRRDRPTRSRGATPPAPRRTRPCPPRRPPRLTAATLTTVGLPAPAPAEEGDAVDITCRKCGDPWEAAYLRHEVAWYTCWHGRTVQRWSTGGGITASTTTGDAAGPKAAAGDRTGRQQPGAVGGRQGR